MSTRRWVLVAVILLAGYWVFPHIAPRTAGVADREGNYIAGILADGGNGDSVRIAFGRPDGVFGTVTITIPSGTVIYNHDANGQRLITAAPVKVVLSNDTPSVTVAVPTFCIDEFAATPLDSANLGFDPRDDQGGVTTEETEPLHKLLDCMGPWSLPFAYKQLAVWAVADDLLHKTRDEALQFLTDKIVQQMVEDRRKQLRERKSETSAKAPILSDALVDDLIENEIREGMSDYQSSAVDQADDQLFYLEIYDKDMLTSCGYAAEDMPVFQ